MSDAAAMEGVGRCWVTGEPPKDGRTFVAMGTATWKAGRTVAVRPFIGLVRWRALPNGPAGWWNEPMDLPLSWSSADQIRFDWWTEVPPAEELK